MRPTLPLRVALVAAIAFGTAGTLVALLIATDTALSIWQRLERLPTPMAVLVGVLFATLAGFAGWLAWRLLRPAKPKMAPRNEPISRETVESRIERIADRVPIDAARAELEALDRRAAQDVVHVALFGEISAGKTSLLRALSGRDDLETDVRGGTTRAIVHAEAELPDGRRVIYTDLPGLNEAGDRERAAMARAEAIRSHALVYVADADLTRAQDEALAAMLALGKPTILALNKSDRYDATERDALMSRLRERYGDRVLVVQASAGGAEERVLRLPDGRESTEVRPRAPSLASLSNAVVALTAPGASALEPARQRAVLDTLSRQLASEEARLRAEDAAAVVKRYTRRAIVGALAAVAPGTDIVIQGALATAMLRELTSLYGVSIKSLDLDAFVQRATGTVRTTTSITLAIAGNVAKAFPGFGTVGGGLLHAIAYGLIFDALGRAVAATLAQRPALDAEAEKTFESMLKTPDADRLATVARIAREAISEARGGNG